MNLSVEMAHVTLSAKATGNVVCDVVSERWLEKEEMQIHILCLIRYLALHPLFFINTTVPTKSVNNVLIFK